MSTLTLRDAPDAALPEPAGRPSRWSVVTTTLGFALGGLAYGTALRAWMRLVAEDPEFTWSGSLFIVGAFVIGFAACGLVAGGRRRGWKGLLVPVRVAAVVLCLPCFGGAGVAMMPTVIPGAVALARHDWPRWARLALLVVAALSTTMLLASGPGELGWSRLLVAYVLYLGLVCVEIRVFSEPYRPTVARLPLVLKIAAALAALGLVLLVALLTVGLFFVSGD